MHGRFAISHKCDSKVFPDFYVSTAVDRSRKKEAVAVVLISFVAFFFNFKDSRFTGLEKVCCRNRTVK